MALMLSKINSFLKDLEDSNYSLPYFFMAFLFIVMIRNFLETFSYNTEIFLDNMAHFLYGYFWTCSLIILAFYFFFEKDIRKHIKTVLFFSVFVWMGPIFDLISLSGPVRISYLYSDNPIDLVQQYLSFYLWGHPNSPGASPGIKLEIFILICCLFYFSYFFKKKNIFKSMAICLVVYSIIFLYGIFPVFCSTFFNLLGVENAGVSTRLISNYFLLFNIINGVGILFFYQKKFFRALFLDLRFLRLVHFFLMFLLGIFFQIFTLGKDKIFLDLEFIINVILTCLSLTFAIVFSIVSNNLTDVEIDKVSNSDRPTIQATIPLNYYKNIGFFSFLLCLIYAANVGSYVVFSMLVFIGNYFLYSMPPTRFKRIPVLSKIFISLNSLLLFMLGNYFISGSFAVSINIVIFFLVFMTLSLNFIDLKDYKGDKAVGILTLPVLCGLQTSKKIIGLFFLITYFSAYLLLREPLELNMLHLMMMVLLGIIQFYLINQKKYSEHPIFIIYFLTIILSVLIF